MAQTAKMLDVTRSYIPMNPNAYAPNLMLNNYQDAPEKAPSVVAYDGRNFLPTPYGYRSYFGISRATETDSLPSRADHIICFQNKAYQNVLVALCEDGIYIKHGASYGNWVKKAAVNVLSDTYREWSYCTVGDSIYCYRTNDFVYYCIPSALYTEHAALMPWTPFLTMATQTGSSPYGVPAGTYRFAAAARYSTGWISGATAWSSAITTSATYILAPYVSYQSNEQLISVRFYIDNGTEIRYKDVTPSATRHDSALCSVSAADWAAMKVVTSVPDEDWYSIPFTTDQPVLPVTPAFLNMAGQLGIFSAGTRLGFWDSEDSVSWSSIDDYTDFTPSLTTLAGSSIFSDVQGRIVTIRKLGDGFVIYATKSIVYVKKAVSALLLWEPVVLLHAGISYSKQVTSSTDKKEHWAWTSSGLAHVTEDAIELVVPEIYDLYKRHNAPVYLDMLDNRYLAIQIMDEEFELRNVLSSSVVVPGRKYTFSYTSSVDELEAAAVANIPSDAYAKWAEAVVAAQFSAAAGVIYNPGQYVPIYDWKLFTGDAYTPQWNSPSYLRSSVADEARTTLDGVAQALTTSNPRTLLSHHRRLSIGGLNAAYPFLPDWKVGTATTPRNKISAFLSIQTELWKRHDANITAMLHEMPNKALTYTRSSTTTVTSYYTNDNVQWLPSHQLACLYSGVDVDAVFPALSLDQFANIWLAVAYGKPTIDISDCSVNLRRRCTRVAELWLKQVSFNKAIAGSAVTLQWGGWTPFGSTNRYYADSLEELVAAMNSAGDAVYVIQSQTAVSAQIVVVDAQGNIQDSRPYAQLLGVGSITVADQVTVLPYLRNIKVGAFHTATASMLLTGWLNTTTMAVTNTSTCIPPVRNALGDITNQVPDVLDPATGRAVDSTSFNSYNYVLEYDSNYQGIPFTWTVEEAVTLPATEFMLQEGSPAPAYPTFYGALVYDTALKKWGRLDQEYKLLLNYAPINGQNGQAVAFSSFQMQAGLLDTYGIIRLFDDAPTESYIRYGKLGYSRKSFTNLEEVQVQFASPSTCSVIAEPSIDGVAKEANYKATTTCTDAYAATLLANLSARWYNVVVSGKYDISHIELHAHTSGRR